ncbi:hypothetical protein BCR36DRAFT_579711 [Piromyces finnis]|uniref:Glycosyltransferase family 71 protein n=1 Tax=Piromyces finnis TaxID=1754191 RepID=A0A1Y1VL97_9FUNG|nr:hypothetical protein BCR36DRAFT_579711 [Piromyces finnis]|eukprot:ORX59073.1 hypothetical protein BCR36DRAFT_579711 [Piromyces finnis]
MVKLYKSREYFLYSFNEQTKDHNHDDVVDSLSVGNEDDLSFYNNNDHPHYHGNTNSTLINLFLGDNEASYYDDVEKSIQQFFLYSVQHPLKSEQFVELRQRVELHTKLWYSIFGKYPAKSNFTFSSSSSSLQQQQQLQQEQYHYKQNLIKATQFLSLNWKKKSSSLTGNQKLLAMLHESLYSWLYGFQYSSLSDILKTSQGKGIVICSGDRYFKYVKSTIITLRTLLHCQLPIEIIFMGDEDLSLSNRKQLEGWGPIYFTDISNTFKNSIVGIEGWAIKPFALIASRFEEIILMDADVTYIRNPEILFEEEGYKATGTFFFKDRTLNQGQHTGVKWLKTWMVDPLPPTKESRFWKEMSEHEMDSSTVVVHKTRALLGLLAVCKFNEYHTRYDVVYRKVLGDKETFWMGFDMARQPYHMNRQPSLFIGELDGKEDTAKELCGHVGHLTGDGKLLYWNGHLVKDKSISLYAIQLLQFDAYVLDNGYEKKWSLDLTCLSLNNEKYTQLHSEDKKIIDKILEEEKKFHYVAEPIKTRE